MDPETPTFPMSVIVLTAVKNAFTEQDIKQMKKEFMDQKMVLIVAEYEPKPHTNAPTFETIRR